MELAALVGLREMVKKYHPMVMIEVQHIYKEEFLAELLRINYKIRSTIERAIDANYLIEPIRT